MGWKREGKKREYKLKINIKFKKMREFLKD